MAILDFSTTHSQVTDYVINVADSTPAKLSHDIFYNKTGKLVTVYTGAGATGTQLTSGTDFELGGVFPDTSLPTSISPDVAYTTISITNATYHNVDLYVNFHPIGDVINAVKYNSVDDRAAEVFNVTLTASTSATHTVDASLAIGKRLLIRRLGAYDTTNTNKLTIDFSGGEVCTPEQLSSIELYGDGGNWLIEKVTATRWEIVSGWDAGENTNGVWIRNANGTMKQFGEKGLVVPTSGVSPSVGDTFDWPIEFRNSRPSWRGMYRRSAPSSSVICIGGGVIDSFPNSTQYSMTLVNRTGSDLAAGTYVGMFEAIGYWYLLS